MIDLPAKSSAIPNDDDFFERACDIVVAFLNNNELKRSEINEVIRDVHRTLSELFKSGPGAGISQSAGIGNLPRFNSAETVPAVAISDSIKPDYIVCLEDGKHLRTLKRYLAGRYGLSPDQYRTKWQLPLDYPMVAPNYSAKRALLAKEAGLGRSRKKAKKRTKR